MPAELGQGGADLSVPRQPSTLLLAELPQTAVRTCALTSGMTWVAAG
jgi:hypothetical protein